jgi:hypothetical protein
LKDSICWYKNFRYSFKIESTVPLSLLQNIGDLYCLKDAMHFSSLVTATATVIFASMAQAASNMVPDYEVKLLLDPAIVLGSDHKLTPTVLSTFAMPTTVTKMNVQFLDTSTEEIYNTGWSPRLRKIEGVADFEETYKKRYAITGGDIDAALTTANDEGFDSDTTTYDAQIEWGYQKQALSTSRQKTASGSGYSGMDLPGTARSISESRHEQFPFPSLDLSRCCYSLSCG